MLSGSNLQNCSFFIQENLFDIIMLNETKIDDAFRDSQFYIKGSRMLRIDRNRYGGGLLIYIRRELIINKLRDFECKHTESITFSMQQKRTTKKIVIIAAYRTPCLSKSLWTQDPGDLLLRIRNRYNNMMVVSDLNCDLSDPDKHDKQGSGLLELLEVYNMSNMIKQPTRVTTSSSSLIDVNLTTSPHLFSMSGVFDLDLSDHKLVYTIMRAHCMRDGRRFVIKRRFKNYVSESFCEDVSRVPFHVASVFDDICWAWTKLLSDVVEDRHAPIKRSKVRRKHVPCMSPELLDAIRLRNKLKENFSKTNDPADGKKYRIQRNLTTSLRRKIIANYLQDKANNGKGDPKQSWNTIKPLMHCNKVAQREAMYI